MAGQQRPKQVELESSQEGSRWIGERPTGEQVSAWFSGVRLDEGMEHADHVGGITIISATETLKRLVNGQITDIERIVHVPYPRVDARIAYFWRLCEIRDWEGEIEPVSVPRVREPGLFNEHLPPGFSKLAVQLPDKKLVYSIACTQRVKISKGEGRWTKAVRKPPPATKQVTLVDRWGKADENAMMKAETGAIGRALGMAGIFVIPGAGVATAEDMQEYLANTGAAGVSATDLAQLPDDSKREESGIDEAILELRRRVAEADMTAEFDTWVQERGFSDPLAPNQKRAMLKRLEQLLGSS